MWGRHGGNGRGDLLHIITHIDTLDQIWEMTHEFEFPNFDIKSNVDINTIEASEGRVTKGAITAAQKKSRKNPIEKYISVMLSTETYTYLVFGRK